MNIEAATMIVPWGEAQQAFQAYRRAIQARAATRDDVTIYRAYRALLRGRKVIDVQQAIGAAGLDARGLPRLAVCRADARWGQLTTQWIAGNRSLVFTHRADGWTGRRRETGVRCRGRRQHAHVRR